MGQQENSLSAKLAHQSGLQTRSSFISGLEKWRTQNTQKMVDLVGEGRDGERAVTRIFSGFQTALEKNPKLMNCTGPSLRACFEQSCASGLAPGVYQECAYLPFNNKGKMEAVFCAMYHGFVRLLYEGGYIKRIDGKVVYENDEFDWEEGLRPYLRFKRHMGSAASRGAPIGVYSLIINCFDEPLMCFLAAEEVLAIKSKAPSARASDSPWNSDEPAKWEPMWIKTALKRNIRLIPKTKKLQEALDSDDQADGLRPKVARIRIEGGLDDFDNAGTNSEPEDSGHFAEDGAEGPKE